jgi:hypothetical protein
MNCELAVELLPWLLNGSLEAGERRDLIEHLRGCAACRSALAETRTAWEIFDWHPPAAALVAHAATAGSAGGGDRSPLAHGAGDSGEHPDSFDVEQHLASCPRCAAELELVRTSRLLGDPAEDERIAILPPAPATPAAGASVAAFATTKVATAVRRDDVAARRAWRRSALAAGVVGLLAATGWLESARHARELEGRLAAASRGAAPAAAPTGATSPASRAGALPAHPTAPPAGPGEAELGRRAGEAEARLAALAAQNRQLQQQVATLDRTAAELGRRTAQVSSAQATTAPPIESDAWVSEVAPADQASRGAGAPPAAVIPLSAGAATLLLHTRHSGSYPRYELEVWDASGHLVGRPARVLRLPGNQDAFEEFDITLRPGALPAGAYTLHLFGLSGPAGADSGGPQAGAPAREPLETYAIRVS